MAVWKSVDLVFYSIFTEIMLNEFSPLLLVPNFSEDTDFSQENWRYLQKVEDLGYIMSKYEVVCTAAFCEIESKYEVVCTAVFWEMQVKKSTNINRQPVRF